jgi:hypothetical protein
VSAMSGNTDDCMTAAIEHSHTIIESVSRAYKASANCRMEAKYANDMLKCGKVQLVFVMMEREYTTRSSPEYVDGWLGMMISDQLWHVCVRAIKLLPSQGRFKQPLPQVLLPLHQQPSQAQLPSLQPRNCALLPRLQLPQTPAPLLLHCGQCRHPRRFQCRRKLLCR